ncbi:hypothetical protein LUZ60_004817 [Juncus effusus]|nr:hypothetical protein LUZ60_004817 [Juncus effusus]
MASTDGVDHRFEVKLFGGTNNQIGDWSYTNLPIFKSGGEEWYIRYKYGCRDLAFVSLFLNLHNFRKPVTVSFKLTISDSSGLNSVSKTFMKTFMDATDCTHGSDRFLRQVDLVFDYSTSGFFLVLCSINVEGQTSNKVSIPNQIVDFIKLLESGEMTDVKFEVEGEIFTAHKLILGARSPVFKAELFGSMAESSMECIKLKDVKREVFKALLHFLYTDSFGEMGNSFVMMQHLLVAADRYLIEGLMEKCEENLSENVSLETLLGLLTFAENHNFRKLKNGCLEFAVKKDTFSKLAVTKEYCQMGQTYPSLLTEIGEKLSHS